jgi:2'-hydroxyisoflavone reductase
MLVLGGTRFLGRAIVDAALAAGHEVTLFNRGLTNPTLYPRLETVIGDRSTDLSGLRGRGFDAVFDVAGYAPEDVRLSATALAGSVGRYVFVSTVSVYADQSVPQVEGAELLELTGTTAPDDLYGARKAACEQSVQEVYGDRAFLPRPGLIVGPHDPTDRFAYWPRRLVRGGIVLAPGDPGDPTQFIDVRELATWIVAGTAASLAGVFNATGRPLPIGVLLETCREVTGAAAELLWVNSDRLLAAGVNPWMGIPLWIAAPGWEAANLVETGRAQAAGLATRPVAETVADTLAWDLARGGPQPGREGLSTQDEERLLDLFLNA